MNLNSISLSSLLLSPRSAATIVAWVGKKPVTWQDFQMRVNALLKALPQQRRWALWCQDSFSFACAFFAALHGDKEIVIPPNFLPGTLEDLSAEIDGVITDMAISSTLPILQINDIDLGDTNIRFRVLNPKQAIIDIFTSGSSGQPKRVRKYLGLLEGEVQTLEQLWGRQLANSSILATVPHHHIYGLLFRLLWPLATARPFESAPCNDPSELLQQLQDKSRVTLISSPAHLHRLGELIDLSVLNPVCQTIFSSGAPLSAIAAQQYRQHLKFAPIEVYGSTETGGIAWRQQFAEAWQPLPGISLTVDENHALTIRSPFTDNNDWTTLADAATLLPSGKFMLQGRLDSIVKIEEKRLSLTEMAHRLKQHQWVADVGMVQLPARRKAVIGAAVVLSTEGQTKFNEIGKLQTTKILKRHLAQYYDAVLLPRYWRFPESLPYSERGKLTQAALTTLFMTEHESAAMA